MTVLTKIDLPATPPRGLVPSPAERQSRSTQISIVVPCYNEAERLDSAAFLRFLAETPEVSLVFVDDGSKDATLEVLSTLHAVCPERIDVLRLKKNSGKAEAVRQGLLFATTKRVRHVGYWDADLATPLDAIVDFARVANRFSDVEVIFGSRRVMLGHRIERTFARRCISRICATLARVAVRLPIGDTQCGAKMLRNTANLRRALAQPFTAGWLFDVELFTRISDGSSDRTRAFYEMPLAEWSEVAGSKVSGRAVVKSGLQMLRLIAQSRLGGFPSPVQTAGDVELAFASLEPVYLTA